MADKLIISVSSQRATIARWRGQLADCRVFANDDTGLAGFQEYLAAVRRAPVYITVDAVEEDYRFETLPHAFGRDRGEMIERKLRQHYRNTPYCSAWLQGRESGKRRDDRYLLSALTNPELIANWLKLITAADLPIASINLLPMVTGVLIEKLGVQGSNILLVGQHSGGLRLTFFRDRQFRLSRLTRGDSTRSPTIERLYADEISNTRLYLHALRTTTLDEHLTVIIQDRADELKEVVETLAHENPSLECLRFGSADLAARLRMDQDLLSQTPDALYMHLLGMHAPAGNLAPSSITAGFRQYRAQRQIQAGAAGLAAAGILWCCVNLWNIYRYDEQTDEAARQTAQLQNQYLEITRQYPAAPTTAENLKRAVEIAQQVRDNTQTPTPFMGLIARALGNSTNIVLREFGWKHGSGEIETGTTTTAAAALEASSSSAGTGSGGASRRITGFVSGEIKPFSGDYRAAIDTINALADRLRSEPGVTEVRVVKLPLDVNPTLSLTGNTVENPSQGTAAEFKLLVVMKGAGA